MLRASSAIVPNLFPVLQRNDAESRDRIRISEPTRPQPGGRDDVAAGRLRWRLATNSGPPRLCGKTGLATMSDKGTGATFPTRIGTRLDADRAHHRAVTEATRGSPQKKRSETTQILLQHSNPQQFMQNKKNLPPPRGRGVAKRNKVASVRSNRYTAADKHNMRSMLTELSKN